MAVEAASHEEASPLPPPAVSEAEKARRSFLDFMTKVTQYEELVEAGERFLGKFHQELGLLIPRFADTSDLDRQIHLSVAQICFFGVLLMVRDLRVDLWSSVPNVPELINVISGPLISEHFRRPKLPMESDAVSELVKSNYTDRMKSYLVASCHLQHSSIRNINQLHSCEEKLEDHINKAKVLLEELQCLVEDVYSTTLTASFSVLSASDDFHSDDNLKDDCCEDKQQPGDQLDSAVSYSSVMILVHNMLKLDYTMQEKIVKALCLKTSSSELEAYCLMWDLRPYIDDNVMQLAWKFVS